MRAQAGGDRQQRERGDGRRDQHERPGWWKGRASSRPSERGRPSQPRGAAAGVGDHPQEQGDRHHRAAELEREATGRGELRAERPDTHEDRDDRGGREREIGRRAEGQPAEHEARELREPQQDHARRDRRQRRGEVAEASDRPGEHQLGVPAVLLGAQSAHRRQQPVGRRDDRDRAAHPPRGVTPDAQRVVGIAVEEAQGIVAREAAREPQAVCERRIGVAVADGLDIGVGREQSGERERAMAGVAKRPPDRGAA